MYRIYFFLIAFLTFSCNSTKPEGDLFNSVSNTHPQSEEDFLTSYSISNEEFGTKTKVVLTETERIMTTNSMPNHETGTFPNPGNPNTISEQAVTYSFPLIPVKTGEARWAREPGVALNGVKFEPETAERFVCETGEVYRIEAIQDLMSLGLDENHAHVQPTGAYHYHGVPVGLVEKLDQVEDIILVGFAHDGFPIYYSKSGKYKPSYQLAEESRTGDACSYNTPHLKMNENFEGTNADGTFVSDWVYKDGLGNLDECNGVMMDGKYVYFVTDEYPYVGRCLKGQFEEKHPQGPPPGVERGNQPQRGSRQHSHGPGERPHAH